RRGGRRGGGRRRRGRSFVLSDGSGGGEEKGGPNQGGDGAGRGPFRGIGVAHNGMLLRKKRRLRAGMRDARCGLIGAGGAGRRGKDPSEKNTKPLLPA
ncbi:MAG: hypothetical protein HUU21_39290, partial [Polyangiaceae bacterium]|nr:hypothetical protein [Polyangiaceae bacterium]